MADEPLEVGPIGAGLVVVDGVVETPWAVGNLSYDPDRGVLLAVPFIDSPAGHSVAIDQQFGHLRRWFDWNDPTPPKNLLVHLHDQRVAMFECRMASSTTKMGGESFGLIAAENVVVGHRTSEDVEFAAPLRVKQLRSRIDGLAPLTRFSAVTESAAHNIGVPTVKSVRIDVESGQSMSWLQGEASMTIESNWTISGPQNRRVVNDDVVLLSEFPNPRSIECHLHEHQKVQRLLTVLVGSNMRFRTHEVRDDSFAISYGPDLIVSSFHPLVHRYTYKEHREPLPDEKRFVRAILPIVSAKGSIRVGEEGLRRWSDHQDEWERVVLPLVSRLKRPGSIEDEVTTAGMCLEAAGTLIGAVQGEEDTYFRKRPTTSTYTFRVLADLGLVFAGPARSARGLARGIANNYNDLKHFNRGRLPDPVHTYLVSRVATLIVRTYLSKLVAGRLETEEDTLPLISSSAVDMQLADIRQAFTENGVRISEEGKFEQIS